METAIIFVILIATGSIAAIIGSFYYLNGQTFNQNLLKTGQAQNKNVAAANSPITSTSSSGQSSAAHSSFVTSQNTQNIVKTSEDLTLKCTNAGGTCMISCNQSLTGSSGSSFFDNFFNNISQWFTSLFGNPNNNATTGSILSTIPQEIGSYPNYCTQQLTKCCVSASVSTSTTSVTTRTATLSANQQIAAQQAATLLDVELSSLNDSTSGLENALLGK